MAEIDGDEFFDFTTVRPRVEIDEDNERSVIWPSNEFSVVRLDEHRDLVVLAGLEPQLKWRTFCEHVLEVASIIDASMIVTLGALLTDIPHTRPTPVYGTTDNLELSEELGLEVSSYEGPTGIVGVLHQAGRAAGYSSASLWAAVPSYVSGASSPKAALALVGRLQDLLGLSMVTTDLEIAAAEYERQVTSLVSEDQETADFVVQLEQEHDQAEKLANPDGLIEEVEEFLKDN